MPLFFEPFQIVAPEGHRMTQQPSICAADLQADDFLLLEEGHCLRDQSLALCGAQRRQEGRSASSLEMLRHMIGAGEGFSLLPLLSVRDRPDLDGLATIRPVESISQGEAGDQTIPGRMIGLVWRARDPRARSLPALWRISAGSGAARHGCGAGRTGGRGRYRLTYEAVKTNPGGRALARSTRTPKCATADRSVSGGILSPSI